MKLLRILNRMIRIGIGCDTHDVRRMIRTVRSGDENGNGQYNGPVHMSEMRQNSEMSSSYAVHEARRMRRSFRKNAG